MTDNDFDSYPSVGIVGLGSMGEPIARRLIGTGIQLRIWDLDQSKVSVLAEAGATPVQGIADLGVCEVVFLVVPSDHDVLEVGGAIGQAATGTTIIVVCSSVDPETPRRLSAETPDAVSIVDAGLGASVARLRAGEIQLMVGGSDADVECVLPILKAFATDVQHLGDVGAGMVGKMIMNNIHWINIAMTVESLEFGERLGVAPARMREALLAGPMASRPLENLAENRLTWWVKDYESVFDAARRESYQLPIASLVHGLMPNITVNQLEGLVTRK